MRKLVRRPDLALLHRDRIYAPHTLPAAVQHLQVLETSGLVRSEKRGRVRTCHIEPAALRPVEQWIRARRSNWERRLDRLGDYLAEGDDEPLKDGTR
jgi:hypothetical protein